MVRNPRTVVQVVVPGTPGRSRRSIPSRSLKYRLENGMKEQGGAAGSPLKLSAWSFVMIGEPVCPEIIFVQLVRKQPWRPSRVPITPPVSTRSSTGPLKWVTMRDQKKGVTLRLWERARTLSVNTRRVLPLFPLSFLCAFTTVINLQWLAVG